MPVVLALSSQVARGHVGNSAAMVALQMMGIDVWPVPTVILSNHPGHGATAGLRVPAATLADMIAMLDGHGWLSEIDAVLSGYIAEPGQAETVAAAVARVRAANPDAIYCCDPILGDSGSGLYVGAEVAQAIRRTMVPVADLVTPNLFELSWLTNRTVETRDAAVDAARSLGCARAMITSAPSQPGLVTNMLVTADTVCSATSRRLERVPHGTGDLMTALVLGHQLRRRTPVEILERANTTLAAVIEATVAAGADELRLVASRHLLTG